MSPIAVATAAAGLAIAFAAGWSANGWRLGMEHENELKRMYQAGVTAYQNRDEKAKQELIEYGQEIRRRAAAPVRRVHLCPDVPATPGGIDGPAPAGDHRVPGRDLGPVLAAARDSLLRCRALIRYLDQRP